MRKISQPIKLANRPGYYLRWTENGKRKYKQVNTLAEAEMFSVRKYQELNLDVYDSVDLSWNEACGAYLQHYDTDGLAASSKYEAGRCLNAFADHFGAIPPKKITQRMTDDFLASLSKEVRSPHTMNKYKGRFKAFIRWLADRNYHSGKIKITMSKTPQRHATALSVGRVRELLLACPTEIWRMRVLVSLVTGLRRNDVEALQVADVDVAARVVRTRSQKTGKVSVKPLPDALMSVFEPYLDGKTERLFPDINVRKEWDALRRRAGLAEKIDGKVKFTVTRQDFRRTHGTLMGLVDGLQAAARALEHSSTAVTQQYYSDLSLIQRVRVNQLPVKDWLAYARE